MMRIISGTHKGRRINPRNKLNLRPTTDRSKEALFNILENRYYFNNKNVLDLFSGTGNISLEFASRGTEEVIAVDNNFASVNFIENILLYSCFSSFFMSIVKIFGISILPNLSFNLT